MQVASTKRKSSFCHFGKLLSLFALLSLVSFGAQAVPKDDDLPDYVPQGQISGRLSSVGSDTLANLMTLWSESFKNYHPSARFEIQAQGSATAPPALIQGVSNLAPMSRAMKPAEIEKFQEHFGYKPLAIPVALDAIAVFVNKDNPIKEITTKQLDALFSKGRRCGHKSSLNSWGDLGLPGLWKHKRISLFGRNSVSGTYTYFKEKSLCKGEYKNTVNEQPGSSSVVQSVGSSMNAIGYSGVGYVTSNVRMVPISKGKKQKPYIASRENITKGKYPFSRHLFIYINKKPNAPLDKATKAFLTYVLSKQGQRVVAQEGLFPLSSRMAKESLKRIASK